MEKRFEFHKDDIDSQAALEKNIERACYLMETIYYEGEYP